MAEEPRYMALVRDVLALRGYVGVSPRAVERVEGEFCWYLDFDLPEGRLGSLTRFPGQVRLVDHAAGTAAV
jgi:hypothetical protein